MREFNVEFVGGPRDGEIEAFPYHVAQISVEMFDGPEIRTGIYLPEKPITDSFPTPHRFVWRPRNAS